MEKIKNKENQMEEHIKEIGSVKLNWNRLMSEHHAENYMNNESENRMKNIEKNMASITKEDETIRQNFKRLFETCIEEYNYTESEMIMFNAWIESTFSTKVYLLAEQIWLNTGDKPIKLEDWQDFMCAYQDLAWDAFCEVRKSQLDASLRN
jgi:hypothetical protein